MNVVSAENRQEELLYQVATQGKLPVTWEELKNCIIQELKNVYRRYVENQRVQSDSAQLYDKMELLVTTRQGAPFTIQRISELLLNPTYSSFEKFCYAFEKLFHVVSCVSEGEDVFTCNLLYLEKNSGWHMEDSESSRASTEMDQLSDAENSTTAVSDLQHDNGIDGLEEESTGF